MVYEMDADAECLICGKRIRSSCATNITAHMARKHPHELVAGCIATGKKKITPVTLRTRTRSMLHAASVETVECSTTEENRQYEITKLLALAVATSSSPIALVDNTLFREYSSRIPHFKPPNATNVTKAIKSEYGALVDRMKKTLANIDVLAVNTSRIPHFKPPNATNVTKAIKSEYGALVDRMKKTLANIDVLAVSVNISLPAIDSPSSDRSLVSVIADFFDPEQETFAHHLLDVVNLQKEHTSDYLMECVRTVMETYGITHKVFRFICSGGSMTRTVLAEPFKYTIANRSDDQQPLDVSNMSNEQLEQLVIKPEYGGDTQMLTASDDVVPMEFFASIDSHIPSALQTLMVVLRECFEENLFMQKLSVYVFEVLKLFTQSATLMKELILETGGKKLLFPGNTSWLTLFIAYRRFLEIFSSMDLVCEKLMCPEIGAIAASLRESLKIHFAEVLHSGECGSDPIYILSTFLDRKTAFLLSNVRKATAIAVTKKMIRLANAISIANDRQEEVKEEGTFLESPYISLISHAIRERERAPLESTCDNVSEVEKYAANYITWPSDENFTNGFDFWRQQKHQFPNLYVLASMCFCVPAAVSSNVTPIIDKDHQQKNTQLTDGYKKEIA
ncbi:hypothetical protein Tcan_07180 [Toxocara canis]|uniref:Uncharacterized protein n=1 Tax=Toxocara canis TaxID=6265 RepID=A0A0B2VE21_TOXCA|nr:hypothetical protein Tcan_07180 [Toxocara canis]